MEAAAPLPWHERSIKPAPGDPSRYFDVRFDKERQTCVLLHRNGIAVCCLAPEHPVLRDNLRITAVDFRVGRDNVDFSQITVSGKKKAGAALLNPWSPICALVCSNGERHTVYRSDTTTPPLRIKYPRVIKLIFFFYYLSYSGVKGALVTANKLLLDDPSLVANDPMGKGHVGVIMLKSGGAKQLVDKSEITEQSISKA